MKIVRKTLLVDIDQPVMANGVYATAQHKCLVHKKEGKYILEVMDVEYNNIVFNGMEIPNDHKATVQFFHDFNTLMKCDLGVEFGEQLVSEQMLLDILIKGNHLGSLD